MLAAKQELVDAVKHGLGGNTEQLRKVGAGGWGASNWVAWLHACVAG